MLAPATEAMAMRHARRMRRTAIAWTLVGAQLLLIVAAVAAPWGGSLWTLPDAAANALRAVGTVAVLLIVPALLGLGRGLTASPVPREEGALATTGAFAIVRHPTYSLLMTGIGLLALASGATARIVAVVALVLLLNVKARWEEELLRERFPDYDAYAARVPRLLPFPRPTARG
jgi:protein-S-isoprenylcysteine O-methyltransferase Ste14